MTRHVSTHTREREAIYGKHATLCFAYLQRVRQSLATRKKMASAVGQHAALCRWRFTPFENAPNHGFICSIRNDSRASQSKRPPLLQVSTFQKTFYGATGASPISCFSISQYTSPAFPGLRTSKAGQRALTPLRHTFADTPARSLSISSARFRSPAEFYSTAGRIFLCNRCPSAA